MLGGASSFEVEGEAAALKKAKDDAVAANIKILENFYSFLISFALTQATLKLADIWSDYGLDVQVAGPSFLYLSLLVTIVPFYQGMNRFLYATHVVRPLEKPGSRSSPLLVDIYAFVFMSCIIFAMGRFLKDPVGFFYLWSTLLAVDVTWSIFVWRFQDSRNPLWAWNNLTFLVLAWLYWIALHTPSNWPYRFLWPEFLPYGFVLFEIARSIFDYRINWKFYFPPEFKGG